MGKIKLLKYKPVHYMVMVCPNESIEDISFRESSESKQVYINVRTVEKAECLLVAAAKYAESHQFNEEFESIEPMKLLREIF